MAKTLEEKLEDKSATELIGMVIKAEASMDGVQLAYDNVLKKYETLLLQYNTMLETHKGTHAERFEDLTARQKKALAGVVKGKTNGEIAKTMKCSEAAVKMLVSACMNKFGVRSRAELVRVMEVVNE